MVIKPIDKSFFSANKTAELAGLSKRQFDSFKSVGLIDYKDRYTLNDIIYVSFSNTFRIHGYKWETILEFYIKIFGSLNNVKEVDFLNNDVMMINLIDGDGFFSFKNREDELVKNLRNHLTIVKKAFKNETDKKVMILDNFCTAIKEGEKNYEIYTIFLYSIVQKIIIKSKELDLKVDVEKILLSA